MLKNIFLFTGLISVIATLLPLLPSQLWWIRIFDFPRIQIIAITIISFIAYCFLTSAFLIEDLGFLIILVTCTIYQAIKIFPYTFFSPTQVLKSNKSNNEENHLSLLISNVMMNNRKSGKCLSMIRKANPDLILAVETDKWWEKELNVLEKEYPFTSFAPLGNTYGMLLYSKLKLISCEIKYLVEHTVPSVHCTVQLKTGKYIKFYGVHPKPPAPQESKTSVHRDAELIIVGKEAKACQSPVIVAGDLNDVAWSHTTHLFQRISGLLDPRIGRGLYPTYNANYPIFRWPLDHVFHSNNFKLLELKRLEYIGSDHYPMYVKLSYEPEETRKQVEPQAGKSDKKEAASKIKKAKQV